MRYLQLFGMLLMMLFLSIDSLAQNAIPPVRKPTVRKPTLSPRPPRSNHGSPKKLTISNILFGNCDKKGVMINPFGSNLYAEEMLYLKPQITYNSNQNTSNITLSIKIFGPDGKLLRSSSSPVGFTYSCIVTLKSGTNIKLLLPAWGYGQEKRFMARDYRWELWKDNKRIYQKTLSLLSIQGNDDVTVMSTNPDVSYDGEVLYESDFQSVDTISPIPKPRR